MLLALVLLTTKKRQLVPMLEIRTVIIAVQENIARTDNV